MTIEEQMETWTRYAGISRGWIQSFDAKAGFITALNLGLLATLWSGSVMTAEKLPIVVKCAGGSSTLLAVISIIIALWAVLPRDHLPKVFGYGVSWSGKYEPISFYGYVATKFTPKDFKQFHSIASQMDTPSVAYEALEQHFVISHIAAIKSRNVQRAGYFMAAAFIAAAITLLGRII